ncbi:capsid and scaffold [Klebsiella phage vB_KpnP_cmc355D]|uniref:Capsid and scaffold n=1 Tax=Klebsiella phage vB_KpnP_cmc355D TaxID=3110534 RepID=A0ABZ0ZXF5_9CAUD|nr:capsid and scaffold [Klebsiella phage vB_KpnP_cmc355D]
MNVESEVEPTAEVAAEVALTPQQKAAITRARNKALKEAQTE